MANLDIAQHAVQKALFEDSSEKLLNYIRQYEKKLKKELSNEGWKKERTDRSRWFQKIFSKKHTESLSELEFKKVFKNLWASNVWSEPGKEWKTELILKDNGIEKLRNSFYDLFYGPGDLAKRYGEAKADIKGLGDSSLTEIMTFVNPNKFCIWNDKPITVLPLLGLDILLPKRVFRYSITGSDYVKCRAALNLVREAMENAGFQPADFLDVDILMWTLFLNIKEDKREEITEKKDLIPQTQLPVDPRKIGHYDAIAIIAKLGKLIGFEAYIADSSRNTDLFKCSLGQLAQPTKNLPDELKGIKGIEKTDVILLPNSGSFEKIYLFEVEDKGTMREALHRLYQCVLLDANMYVIGPKENLSKFEKYANTQPFSSLRFKEKCRYKNFDELLNLYQKTLNYFDIKKDFFGDG